MISYEKLELFSVIKLESAVSILAMLLIYYFWNTLQKLSFACKNERFNV